MDPIVTGSLIGAGGGLIGGMLGQDASRDATNAQKEMARHNIRLQKEFAKNGIRWKVADAKAAGLHPLAALGASSSSFSPVGIGGGPDTSMANAVASMGQDIGRAVQSTRTAEERLLSNLAISNAEADLQGKQLDNQIRASQLQKMSAVGPPLPSAAGPGVLGSGDAFNVNPAQLTASSNANPGLEAGIVNDVSYVRSTDGSVSIAPSKDVKERIEDQLVPELMWALRNQVLPFVGGNVPPKPPRDWLPKGASSWWWNGVKYVPISGKSPTFKERFTNW